MPKTAGSRRVRTRKDAVTSFLRLAASGQAKRAFESYAHGEISERHRHRYEFNPEYRDRLAAAGLVLSGSSPDGALVEIVEVADHPWFLGCQFHPEFASTPFRPHPLFVAFVAAALERGGSR